MMQLVFSDAQYWEDFLPLTFTRPVAAMRCGILTFSERWQKILENTEVTYFTEIYLQDKFKTRRKKKVYFSSQFPSYRNRNSTD